LTTWLIVGTVVLGAFTLAVVVLTFFVLVLTGVIAWHDLRR
jgi:hypothetical protein